MGWDENGHNVYIASKRNLGNNFARMVGAILDLTQEARDKVLIIDTMPYVNLWMVIGGFLSRRWGFKNVGRSIVLYGTRQSYFKFIQLVTLVKQGGFQDARRSDAHSLP